MPASWWRAGLSKMTISDRTLSQALIAECERRIFGESVPRLKKCLSLLNEEDVWFRPNAETISVGNLILHLCGNVRQWLIGALGGNPDNRQRDAEFSEQGPIPVPNLLQRLTILQADSLVVLHRLDDSALVKKYTVQGFEESGVSILVHVIEHFSYHTGQISYYTKTRKAIDLNYYGSADLTQKNCEPRRPSSQRNKRVKK